MGLCCMVDNVLRNALLGIIRMMACVRDVIQDAMSAEKEGAVINVNQDYSGIVLLKSAPHLVPKDTTPTLKEFVPLAP